jgi:organic radical activating enzyme
MNDLPVFSKGCDSSYSWSKKFSHLANTGTASDICDKLESYLKSNSNPDGKFLHPKSNQWTHMAFTGGEPMMNQTSIVDIMQEFANRGNLPRYVTIETNGTQELRGAFINYFNAYKGELFWSVSPKLYLSGEKWEEAINPDVVYGYKQMSDVGQLKYVSNGSDRAWKEVELATMEYNQRNVCWPVWIMPVGADIEGQNRVAAMVTEGAVERGYNVAARVHTYIFGNVVGK